MANDNQRTAYVPMTLDEYDELMKKGTKAITKTIKYVFPVFEERKLENIIGQYQPSTKRAKFMFEVK